MITLSKLNPDFIYRDNKAVAAIIDIDIFDEIIEKLEDEEDVSYLKEARKKTLNYRKFKDYISEKKNV
jgi:hypothetical protein